MAVRDLKKCVYRLRQNEEGKWMCRTKHMPKSYTIGDTPNDAIERMYVALDDYANFLDHLHGNCDESVCQRCKEGKTQRGIWPKDQ